MTLQQALALIERQKKEDPLAEFVRGAGANLLAQGQRSQNIDNVEGQARYIQDRLNMEAANKLDPMLKQYDFKGEVPDAPYMEMTEPMPLESATPNYAQKKKDIAAVEKTNADRNAAFKKSFAGFESETANYDAGMKAAEENKKSLTGDIETLRNLLNTQKAWGNMSPENTAKMNALIKKLSAQGLDLDNETVSTLRKGGVLSPEQVSRLSPYSTAEQSKMQKMPWDENQQERSMYVTSNKPVDTGVIERAGNIVSRSKAMPVKLAADERGGMDDKTKIYLYSEIQKTLDQLENQRNAATTVAGRKAVESLSADFLLNMLGSQAAIDEFKNRQQ